MVTLPLPTKLQTEFGENRCTQFRVIVVTDYTPTNAQTHKHTDRTDYNPLRRSLARSVMTEDFKRCVFRTIPELSERADLMCYG